MWLLSVPFLSFAFSSSSSSAARLFGVFFVVRVLNGARIARFTFCAIIRHSLSILVHFGRHLYCNCLHTPSAMYKLQHNSVAYHRCGSRNCERSSCAIFAFALAIPLSYFALDLQVHAAAINSQMTRKHQHFIASHTHACRNHPIL